MIHVTLSYTNMFAEAFGSVMSFINIYAMKLENDRKNDMKHMYSATCMEAVLFVVNMLLVACIKQLQYII